MEHSAHIWASLIHVRYKPITLAEKSKAVGSCQDFSKRTRTRIFAYKYVFSHFKTIFTDRYLEFWVNTVLKFFNLFNAWCTATFILFPKICSVRFLAYPRDGANAKRAVLEHSNHRLECLYAQILRWSDFPLPSKSDRCWTDLTKYNLLHRWGHAVA
jgi:hypothetical protein